MTQRAKISIPSVTQHRIKKKRKNDSACAKTSTSGVTSASPAERKRHQRARDRELLYSRDDWRLFLDSATLPQKAGCHPTEVRKVVLKELVDNQLGQTGEAELLWVEEQRAWEIRGPGDGPALAAIPKLFSVRRPLVSSKLKRLLTRGLLGNGLRVVMGAVHALGGWLVISLRGHKLSLEVDPADGSTKIAKDEPAEPGEDGIRIRINLGPDSEPQDGMFAHDAIYAADKGELYNGPSSPWWYGPRDLHLLFGAAPPNAIVRDVLADLGLEGPEDLRRASALAYEDCKPILESLRAAHKSVAPEKLGRLGQDAYLCDGYACKLGWMITPAGAEVPYVVEVWAEAQASEKRGLVEAEVTLLVNRTRALAPLHTTAVTGGGIKLRGCGLERYIELKSAQYEILLSILTPYVQLAGDGKEPVLPPFGNAIKEAFKRACNAAWRALEKPPGSLSIKEAAHELMEEAYLTASGQGALHATARQVMYAARRKILKLTGRKTLDDQYFTQALLPDFQEDNPELTAAWKVTYDARGHFTEPHTDREIGLGTVEVRSYLETEITLGPAVSLAGSQMYPTHGPLNRYKTILFIEKEGFGPLLEDAQIARRFDLGIMSTKGMSVTAARELLDELSASEALEKVVILHDFDAYGFSIFGTLFTDTRRYKFKNEVLVVDLGLRLQDVQELGLAPEPYVPKNWDARIETLRRHGATPDEIEFLRTNRVELNAMTAPQFIAFLERKLAIHANKVVPPKAVIEAHARRVWEQLQARERCKEILQTIHAEAAEAQLPSDLVEGVKKLLKKERTLCWDQAVAELMSGKKD
jgi:hypothetical protein